MVNEQKTEEAIADAAEYVAKQMGAPEDMWHPDCGWIIRKGVWTDEGVKWWREVVQKTKR